MKTVFEPFQSLGRDSVCSYQARHARRDGHRHRFNPSVGILFVHTASRKRSAYQDGEFQSLGRDSVCSYFSAPFRSLPSRAVSIPRSGFCLFIPECPHLGGCVHAVSIPRSGFCLFIRNCGRRCGHCGPEFQSLGRDSVCSYAFISVTSWTP